MNPSNILCSPATTTTPFPLPSHVVAVDHSSSASAEEVDDEEEDVAVYVSIVEEYFRCLNAHDVDGVYQFVTPNVCYQFLDNHNNLIHEMAWDGYQQMMTQNMFRSFPDFKLTLCQSDKTVVRDTTTGRLMVWPFHIVATGTHTGEPFSFGPCTPIEASGKFIELDPEYACFTFDEGHKICKCEIRGHQELTGPAGFYTKLGGFPLLGTLPPALPAED